MKIGRGEFWQGDCLDVMGRLPDQSVDMILCDLPYGTTQNKWDTVIPFEPLWSHYWRLLRPNGAVVLTAAQPFTSALIMSQIERFKYEWIWEKTRPVGHLNAKKRPMNAHESVLVFGRGTTVYNPLNLIKSPRIIKRSSSSSNYNTSKLSNFSEFTNYPKSILKFANGTNGIHPTQKPVDLFEYLIRTYTDEGMTVLDNCAGSGTTAVAAERCGRKWVCIERDPIYYVNACARVIDHVAGLTK